MKDLTKLVILIDKSGSMGGSESDVIGGINSLLNDQQATNEPVEITLIQFDHAYEVNYVAKSPSEAPRLNSSTYQPRGSTALFDALMRAINETGAELAALPESDRPSRVLVVVYSDGGENSSKEFKSLDQIRSMVEHQRTVYSWEFLFLGADMDGYSTGVGMGFSSANSVSTSKMRMCSDYMNLSSSLKSYSRSGNFVYTTDDTQTHA